MAYIQLYHEYRAIPLKEEKMVKWYPKFSCHMLNDYLGIELRSYPEWCHMQSVV